MQAILFRLFILVGISTVWSSSAQAAQSNSLAGEKIIVTTAGAELKTPETTVWRAYLGEVFTISLVNGEWLWIQEKGGWMWEKDGILFNKAISVASDRLSKKRSAEAYHIRGVVFVAHKQYDRALRDFSDSLTRSPRNAGVLNNRGQCHYLRKDYGKAISDFTDALRIAPEHFVALNNRALAHMARTDYMAALADVQQALKLNPKYPEALLNRGVIRETQGQSEEAIADYTAAIKIHKTYAAAFGNRAYSYRSLDRYQEAIADLKQAMKLAPKSHEPVNDLAFTLATAKDDRFRNEAQALALAEQAISMAQQEHWNTMDTLAVARASVNDFEGAALAVKKALELAPENKRAMVKSHQELIAAQQPIRE